MKKIITILILLAFFKGNSQCPAPSNLVYTPINTADALLSWTENGTATTWDIAVVPDFYVGAPLPSNGWMSVTSNPFTYLALPPGCNVFFVRSVCSTTAVSTWTAVASSGCPLDVFNYLVTLSSENFDLENEGIHIFPNPSSYIFKVISTIEVDKITVFDTLGKEVLTQTQNNGEINIEKLSNGIYVVEISSENKKIYRKLIKK